MLRVASLFAVGLALAGTTAFGQDKSPIPPCSAAAGSARQNVTGTVTDKTGAVITSAGIQMKCGDHIFEAHTSGDGRYSIALAPGDYLLQVNAAGFATYERAIHLDQQAMTSDVALAVPNAANTVTVQAERGYVVSDSLSAMKIDTPILETPQSISVITRDELDAQAPQSLSEALRYAPGLVPESEGPSSSFWIASSLFLRGFVPDVYQDGLADDTYGNTLLDSYFYQRIEVLEGPSSVLYGQGNPAGLVNVKSKLPLGTPFREVQVGFGSYGRYEGNFDFSGPLFSPSWLYRLTGVGYTEGTQTWFVDSKRLAIGPALAWIPDAKTSLTLLSNYTYNPAVGAYAYVPASGTALPNPNGKIPVSFFPGDPNFNTVKQSFVQAGDSFTRIFGNDWRVDQDFRFTGNRDLADMIWPEDFEADNATLDRYTFTRHVSFDSYLSDNRISKTLQTGSLRQTLLAGLNYSHYAEKWNWGSGDIAPINVFHPVYGQQVATPEITGFETTKDHQTGIYIQDQASLGRFRLSFGGREDWLSIHDVTDGATTDIDKSKFTLRTGLTYLAGKGIAPYFSYATSFQPDLAIGEDGSPLPPTTGKQYEAGIKYQPEHTNLLLTGAVYDLAEQNVGVTDPVNPNFEIPVGEIRSRGVEVQAHATLKRRLNFVTSYAYTASKYNRSNNTGVALDGTTESTEGKYQYGIPLNTASLWLDYSLPFRSWQGLGISGGSRFTGASWGDNVNSFKVPGATLFDGGVHYDFSNDVRFLRGTRLQINGSNLGNRTYVASCFATDGCYYGLTRTVYGTMKYRW